jgi:peptidoglycan/LPS O-acetylase OafA/YrhL
MGHASLGLRGGDPRHARHRIAGVESLRAIAAISVLGFHAAFASGLVTADSWLKPFASRLEVGVSIFFVISGFLLYRSWARAHLSGGRPPLLSRYTASRVLRIVPGYWVALTLISIWIGLESVLDFPGFVVYFAFAQNYDPDTLGGGLLQAWSLGVEVAYYAFLPVFAWAVTRLRARDLSARWRNQWIGVAALFLAGVAWNAAVTANVDAASRSLGPLLALLPAYLDQFALGMGFALITLRGANDGKDRQGTLGSVGTYAWLALAAGAFFLAARGIGLSGGHEQVNGLQLFVKHNLFSVVAVSLLVISVLASGFVRRVFEWNLLRWLGLVSYGIFLWHLAMLTQIEEWGMLPVNGSGKNWLTWFALALVPTAAVAACSWYLIERPALEARRPLAAVFRAVPWRRETEPAS